ncbi:MAG TPA: DMT family transporter [Candidatus Polarisedimenticolia bacterium]|nr:DMT family transporter [Candidatus Polarisedimenticolia bacterium]
MSRPAFSPGLALVVAVVAVSWGSIFARLCHAPPLVIAFHRLGFSTLLLLPILAARGEATRLFPRGHPTILALASGLLLALHFATWISSLALTTIASSVVIVSTQPVFSALISSRVLGEKAPVRLYVGVSVCLAGTLLISGGDLSFSPDRLVGDLLALAGAAAAAGYFVVGRSLRTKIPFVSYLVVVNGSGALFLGVMAVAVGESLTGQRPSDYFWFLMMALVPSLLGHTCLNWAVRHLEVYRVNLTAFGEPVLATLYAFLLFGERPAPSLWTGAALVFAGVLLALPRHAEPVSAD